MARDLTQEERTLANDMIDRARMAMAQIEDWSQKDCHQRKGTRVCWLKGNTLDISEFYI